MGLNCVVTGCYTSFVLWESLELVCALTGGAVFTLGLAVVKKARNKYFSLIFVLST